MLIDVLRPDVWDQLNEQVRNFLGLAHSKINVRTYQGLAHAVYEICKSTGQFMAHKKNIALISGQTDVFQKNLGFIYKDGFDVQVLEHQNLLNVKEWVDQLPKETCYVVFAEDHPVTAQLYPFVEQLDELLNAKRIYSFRVSHFQHFYDSPQVKPYSVRICSYSADCAVAVLGERFRSPALFCEGMDWNTEKLLHIMESERSLRQLNRLLVEDFEKQISEFAKLFFDSETMRIYDRATCYFPDVNAEALGDLILKKMGLTSEEGWKKMATTSLCHWGQGAAPKMFRHWWRPEPSIEILRGMLIFSIEILSTKDFAKFVLSSYEELKQQQSWTV